MVRLHPLSLFLDGPRTRVLRQRRGSASHHPGRVRHRISDAPARCCRVRPYRRPHRPPADDADVGRRHDDGDAGDRRASDPCAGRRRGRRGAVPAALRDGFFGRRRIYRRRRLFAGRRAAAPARPDRFFGVSGERDRRVARGRRLGPDGRLDERSRASRAGAGGFPSWSAPLWREPSGSRDRQWRNRRNSTGRWRPAPCL